ncbi:hypothetical protein EV421DRAFT_2020655 [Armillaria borealis]|uniref:LysM domain-containing protein n=1 Tax=Armillaria borealis TaxID=47425 RepID=A0AA39JBT5_9AGAR|nr:hypothetical protein EV421DRAFT_2020655 [Armillaria borealis]
MFSRTFTLIAIIAVAISVKAVCDSGVAGSTHVVNPGDTCWGIATEAGIDVPQLQAANPGIKSSWYLPNGRFGACGAPLLNIAALSRDHYAGGTVSSSLPFAIELSLFAFQKLAPLDDGRINVAWNYDEPDAPESLCGNLQKAHLQ